MLDHLGLDFRARVSSSIKVTARTGAGVGHKPVDSEVPVEMDSRAYDAEVTAKTSGLGP